jgi:hypothetical protein
MHRQASDLASSTMRIFHAAAGTACSEREHYIPIRKAELVRLLAAQECLPAYQQKAFEQLCRLLEATLHYEYHERLEELKNLYADFDPDAAEKPREQPAPAARGQRVQALFDQLTSLIERANYRRLSSDDWQRALAAASNGALRLEIDFDLFNRLEVFARGSSTARLARRRLKNRLRAETVEVPCYSRLIVLFQPRTHKRFDQRVDAKNVYLKLFKDIPQADLEMLLPGTEVRMTLLDRGRIFLPVVSGVGLTVYKIVTGAMVLAFAGLYGILAFFGLVGGTLGYGVKSFLGYLRAKDKHQLNLTRSLYYQNLDNNGGVLFRLLDEAEEQEFREAILAYFLLWRKAGAEGWPQPRLDCEAEIFLRHATGREVDFEVADALEKLRRLELVELLPCGTLRAVPISEALQRLDRAWDNYFPFHTARRAA